MFASTSRTVLGSLRVARAFSTSTPRAKKAQPLIVELIQDVPGLGRKFDRVEAKRGFVLSYLLPRRLIRLLPWKKWAHRPTVYIRPEHIAAPGAQSLIDGPNAQASSAKQAVVNLADVPDTLTFKRRTIKPDEPALHGSISVADVTALLADEYQLPLGLIEFSFAGLGPKDRIKALGTFTGRIAVRGRKEGKDVTVAIERQAWRLVSKIPSTSPKRTGFGGRPLRQPSPGAANVPTMPMLTNRGRGFMLAPSTMRLLMRLLLLVACVWLFRNLTSSTKTEEIQKHGVFERVLTSEKYLDVQANPFLQSRRGRDERPDLFDEEVSDGILDYWTRFRKPFITSKESAHYDTQVMKGVVDDLLKFNGWVTGGCQTLIRPFDSFNDNYDDLVEADNLYYVAIIVNQADHFVVDQLAVVVGLARRLGTRNIFVSILDQGSTDATQTLCDITEAVLTILGIAFRIRRIPAMPINYYPLEEAEVRNLALEPLHELNEKRNFKFHRVIWLKGFTCPTDVLESLRVSEVNKATMVCGMDWAEHSGFFIFSDRWRTRDIAGDLFRQARSSSNPEAGPPRDPVGTQRYAEHLPFQVFCCESGTHVVDPAQSYYRGIRYRASHDAVNVTDKDTLATDPETPCMDSAQMWFCRDLWVDAAKHGGSQKMAAGRGNRRSMNKREVDTVSENLEPLQKREAEAAPKADDKRDAAPEAEAVPDAAEEKKINKPAKGGDKLKDDNKDEDPAERKDRREDGSDKTAGDNVGSNLDAMEEDASNPAPEALRNDEHTYLFPNSAYEVARILVNPRCLTTYGGVSHTKLALDLFGGKHGHSHTSKQNLVIEEWQGAPDSFVCQEMRTTGGRTAQKSQRRVSFLLQYEVDQ
ncbi:hypothetical protein CspHIS471_0510480 [Cutaneotrichosporon sp. HIS471]|nr:hypothetical protein CspHIS471_0510480 [Cutaneotrichosporon sp. HIS471]